MIAATQVINPPASIIKKIFGQVIRFGARRFDTRFP
jgi:hypothetical protein